MKTERTLACLAGGVLALASALKAHALLTIEQPARGFLYSRGLLSAVAAVELVLALALVFGIYGKIALNVARLLFFVFLEVTLYLAATGAKVCPCLGVLALHPWTMVGVDASILIALFACDARALSVRTVHTHPKSFAGAAMLCLLLGAPALLAMNRHTPEWMKAYARSDRRLQGNLAVAFKNADDGAILAEISRKTGIVLDIEPSVSARPQRFEHLQFPRVPVWVLMEHVARTHDDARWNRVGDEYYLAPLPFWQRLNPWWVAVAIALAEGVVWLALFRKAGASPTVATA